MFTFPVYSLQSLKMILEKLMLLPVFVLFINLFVSGLLINIIQLSLWLCLRPASKWLYQKLNYYLLYTLWIRKLNSVFTNVDILLNILTIFYRNCFYWRMVVLFVLCYFNGRRDLGKNGQWTCNCSHEPFIWGWLAHGMACMRTV